MGGMTCFLPRCFGERTEGDFCGSHQAEYQAALKLHFGPLATELQERWKIPRSKVWQRIDSVLQSEHYAHFTSWRATWLQMVDNELLNAMTLPPEPPKSSYFKPHPPIVMPQEAYRAGQAKLAANAVERKKLEAQLDSDVADYRRGRRMELELELKTKSAAAKTVSK